MDGAWALYEAWVRLQHGDIDTASNSWRFVRVTLHHYHMLSFILEKKNAATNPDLIASVLATFAWIA